MTIQPPLPGLADIPVTAIERGLKTLFHYPNVSGHVLARHGPMIGRAGDAFADSILQRHGIPVLKAEGLQSDRLIVCDSAYIGLQIKTTTHPDEGGTYRFQVRQGCNRRGAGRRAYAAHQFDITALVMLPQNVVRFVASRAECHAIRVSEIAGLRARPIVSLVEALAAYNLHFGPLHDEEGVL